MKPTAEYAELAQTSDLHSYWLLDGDGEKCFESPFLARAMWVAVRKAAWEHRWGRIGPPWAACRWDGIGRSLLDYCPTRAGFDWEVGDDGKSWLVSKWDPEEGRRRLEADVASVERFRATDARGAAEIKDELDQYVADLRVLYEAGRACAADAKNMHAWSDYQVKCEKDRRLLAT